MSESSKAFCDAYVRLTLLGLELMFVLVRKVVEGVERKLLLKFGRHWRSLELASGRH